MLDREMRCSRGRMGSSRWCSGRSKGIRGTAEIRFGFWVVSMRHSGSMRVNVGSLQVNVIKCSNSK